MDSKKIKSHLKDAKEAIKQKNIDVALKLCKEVLKSDRSNYLALVIFGAALQESDLKNEAPTAYRNAIKISPNQLLAWQGLASYYEKQTDPESLAELTNVYEKMLYLESDENRLNDLFSKLEKLEESYAMEVWRRCLNSDKDILRTRAMDRFSNIFSLKEIPDKNLKCYRDYLEKKMEYSTGQLLKESARMYFKTQYKMKNYDTLVVVCKNAFDANNADAFPLEWICKLYVEDRMDAGSTPLLPNVKEYYEKLLELNSNSNIAMTAKGVHLYCEKDYVSSREILNDVVSEKTDSWQAWYFLSKVHYTLHLFKEAAFSITHCKKHFPQNCRIDAKILDQWTLEVMSKLEDPEKLEDCIHRCNEMLQDDESNTVVIRCLIRAAIYLKKFDLVESNLVKLEDGQLEFEYLYALYKFNYGDRDGSLRILEDLRYEAKDFSEHLMLQAEIYSQLKKDTNAFKCFLQAAKTTPYVYTVFIKLGDCYQYIAKDMEKARRCYHKAFKLNPYSEEAGIAFSDSLRKLNYQADNYELLKMVTANGAGKWAWLRLGLHHLNAGDVKSAKECLRVAIRSDQNDPYCWESLGDACYANGSYVSALKCYVKCVELNPESVFAALQIATIKSLIGEKEDSIREFRNLAARTTNYIPVLKGYAETCLSYAQELNELQVVFLARKLCQEAANILFRALVLNNQLSCLWKLMADVCIFVSELPDNISSLSVSSNLVKQKADDDEQLTLNSKELMEVAIKCYIIAANLSTNQLTTVGYLWHDISYCCNLMANLSKSASEKHFHRKQAMKAAKKSISLCPNVWRHWNLLGVIAMSDDIRNLALAQHCFCKAIECDDNNSKPWSNLGILFYEYNDVQLANESYRMAQRIDPNYPRSWIGQALIAESVSHVETAELFYHATELGYHPESAAGIAEWVCKILKNWDTYKDNRHCYDIIEKMDAIHVALNALTWYTVRNPENSCALNMFSVLLELIGLLERSVETSKKSFSVLNDDANVDIVNCNLARQLLKFGNYEESVKVFESVKETDFRTQCLLALSLVKSGKYEKALSCYKSAIDWFTPDETDAARVSLAIATLHYLSGKYDEARSILLESVQSKSVHVSTLFFACAFGLLNSDFKLSKVVLNKLETYENDEKYVTQIATFYSHFYYMQVIVNKVVDLLQQNVENEYKSSVEKLSAYVSKYPKNMALRVELSKLWLRLPNPSDFEDCCGISMDQMCSTSTEDYFGIDSSFGSVISVILLQSGKAEDSLCAAAEAVCTHPDRVENWATLIASRFVRGDNARSLKNLTSYVRRKFNSREQLNAWLGNMERRLAIDSE